jgi:hypothetical protein
MKWASAIVAVDSREYTLLPQTRESLEAAGFSNFLLVMDRGAVMGGLMNWWRAALLLWEENSTADRFVIFEDDCLAVPHLREYLERAPFDKPCYYNLFTTNLNERKDKTHGWYYPPYKGLGAVGLMFDQSAMRKLLSDEKIPAHVSRGYRTKTDALIKRALSATHPEFVHYPSLLQHTGTVSTQGHNHGRMRTFDPHYDPLVKT